MAEVFEREINPATELEVLRFKKFGTRVTAYEEGFRIVSYHLNGKIMVDSVVKMKPNTEEPEA